jgi:queuine tRNA-ribosyltransferase
MLRPGAERIARLGGLHTFMRWPRTILTDSGGFQVMSLGDLRKLDADGVTFRSHIDGSEHRLTPERSIAIQSDLGADIQMQLDECLRLPAAPSDVARAMELSLAWAERSRLAVIERGNADAGRALFGIVQGGTDEELRRISAEALAGMDFDGYAIGGLAVGEPQARMFEVIGHTAPRLPSTKPRYLMGVGTPQDIVGAVARGIDMFDCVLPTRAGRHGLAYTGRGKLNLKNARFADDPAPLDAESSCPAARQFSRAYLHHLVKAGEYLAAMVLTFTNVAYYQMLMRVLRDAIEAGRLAETVASLEAGWRDGEA